MTNLVEALALLTPYDVNLDKVRVGPSGDGGYVLVDGLSSGQDVLSYGISTEYQFDHELASRGRRVWMFDHTIDGIDRSHENMKWYKEGVAGRTDLAARLFSIEDHLEKYKITGDRMILKMDVEGAEYDALNATSSGTLERFDQIVLEVHHLQKLGERRFRRSFVAMFDKLNATHTLFHVHANNYRGYDSLALVEGMLVANILELSYVKTSLVERRPSRTIYPTELDSPNRPHPELPLLFYPFVPASLGKEQFARAARMFRAREIDRRLEQLAAERASLEREKKRIGGRTER